MRKIAGCLLSTPTESVYNSDVSEGSTVLAYGVVCTITKRVKSIPFTLTRAFRLVPAYLDAAYLRKNLKQEGAYV